MHKPAPSRRPLHRSTALLLSFLVVAACQQTPEPLRARTALRYAAPIAATSSIATTPSVDDPNGEDSDWQFAVKPYLWFAGQNGDVGVGPLEADLDLSFGDIVEDLDLSFMVAGEARHGDWAILIDGTYTRTKDEGSLGNLVPSEAVIDQTMVELDLAYRPGEQEVLELLAGARFWSLGLDLEVGAASTDRRREWIDPIVGGRAQVPLDDDWTLQFRGDVGGFGVGSDLSFHLLGTILYALGESATIGLGYRHIDVDYDNGSFDYDVATSGPILGLIWNF